MAEDEYEIEVMHYAQIIDAFEDDPDPEELELWKYKTLIKLMQELKQARETQERIKNSIIIINALFNKNDTPDEFNSRGIQTTELSTEDKEIFHAHLRKELLIQ